MNDPGLDGPVGKNAKDVEGGGPYEDKDEAEDDQAFLKPRYILQNIEEACISHIPVDGGSLQRPSRCLRFESSSLERGLTKTEAGHVWAYG